jgi:hypothetical protein
VLGIPYKTPHLSLSLFSPFCNRYRFFLCPFTTLATAFFYHIDQPCFLSKSLSLPCSPLRLWPSLLLPLGANNPRTPRLSLLVTILFLSRPYFLSVRATSSFGTSRASHSYCPCIAHITSANATADCISPVLDRVVENLFELVGALEGLTLSDCGCTGDEILELIAVTLEVLKISPSQTLLVRSCFSPIDHS